MDIFMDKLAQKATAQEIIKANTTADLEELRKLRGQSAEYAECLANLKKLTDEGFQKLEHMREDGDETHSLVAENIKEVSSLRQDMGEFRLLLGELQGQVAAVGKNLADMSGQTEAGIRALEEKIDVLCGQLEALGSGQVIERLDTVEENVHKECVKVYRNVQAVMVEESGKQKDAMEEAAREIKNSRGKLGMLVAFSALAMVFALAGVVVQILSVTNILSL